MSLVRHASVIVLSFGSLLLQCGPNTANGIAQAERPERNILLFVTDDESPNLGCYGDPVARTPSIDALAADGVRYSNAFATVASCSPSRSVILSGVHSHKNGQYGLQHRNHHFASFHNIASLTLPRVLAAEGYRTARCGKFHVAPEAAYHFESTLKGESRNVVRMAENCRAFLEQTSDERPFFLYFATNDPHRSGRVDDTSQRRLKPNLFGNLPNGKAHAGVNEIVYDPADVPVPAFLSDTPETREELAHYYQACVRIDQGLGRLVEILKETGQYDKTLIVFTSDHGMAFPGAKTTVYDAGLRVPFVVRSPYAELRGIVSDALLSHVDITPSLLDFAGGLDFESNAPRKWRNADALWAGYPAAHENRNGDHRFESYQGKSWMHTVGDPSANHRESIFASHTFHEVQMYYPMRVVRDRRYKLIWNIAHKIDYPFASDLWAASSWQAQFSQGVDAPYGFRTVRQYIKRPQFELYDIANDPDEKRNLVGDAGFEERLNDLKAKLRARQSMLEDPWVSKWTYK